MKFPYPPRIIGIGMVELLVADLSAVVDFYRTGIGLEVIKQSTGVCELGSQGRGWIRLREDRNLSSSPPGSAGLYHLALLFSSQRQLAVTLNRLLSQYGFLFQGSADHLVSEAFYFQDPEGNGVEIYADRPEQLWQWHQHQVQMNSLYLDPDAYIASHASIATHASIKKQPTQLNQAAVVMGHIHLQVGDLQQAEDFYGTILGLVKTAVIAGALFMSDGRYHHYLGLNTWQSLGASKRTFSLGLACFEILVKGEADLHVVLERLRQAQWHYQRLDAGVITHDPWGNQIVLLVPPEGIEPSF